MGVYLRARFEVGRRLKPTRFPKDDGYQYFYISVFYLHRFRRRDRHCNALRMFTRSSKT